MWGTVDSTKWWKLFYERECKPVRYFSDTFLLKILYYIYYKNTRYYKVYNIY